MWQAVPITEDVYGFQHMESYHEDWAATAFLQEKDPQHLKVNAQISITYISNQEEYTELKEAIQALALDKKGKNQKATIYYDVKGIASFNDEATLPVKDHPKMGRYMDTEFSEELGV